MPRGFSPMLPRRAFSMMEVMLVVILLGILAAVVIPNISQSDAEVAAAAGRVIAKNLEYAQSEAMRRQEKIRVTFTASPPCLQIILDSDGSLLENPAESGTTLNLRTLTGNDDLSLPVVNFGGGSMTVSFDALGGPFQGTSTTPVSNDAGVTVRVGDAQHRVVVVPVTGKVRSNAL